MYGKQVAPVDYSLYLQEPPSRPNYRIRNRAEPDVILQSTETSPLYSSFARNWRDARLDCAWPRGRNEFDRQLDSARRRRSVLRRHEQMDRAREHFARHARTGFARTKSVDYNIIATSMKERLSPHRRVEAKGEGTSTSTPTLTQRIISSAPLGQRRPQSSQETSTCPSPSTLSKPVGKLDHRLTPGVTPLRPVRVRNKCLVVQRRLVDAVEEKFLVTPAGRLLPQEQSGGKQLSGLYDEHLMHLLRENFASCR